MTVSKRNYGVNLVRGPVVTIAPHAEAVSSRAELLNWVSTREQRRPLAADLFCGAGGLSLGLSDAGYDVVLGIDSDPVALETYTGLHPGLALCRDLSDVEAREEAVELLSDLDVEMIAGGPPCQPFSRAGASKIRSLVQAGVRAEHDDRRDHWRAFLEIVLRVHPRAVLLENVPDMATASDSSIVRALVSALEADGYAVHTALLRACDQGVPQFRQRFFLVALAEGIRFDWPVPSSQPVTVDDAIADLPTVEGGWRTPAGTAGFLPYRVPLAPGAFVQRAREGLSASDRHRVYDHITRAVREDDRVIFESMDSTTRYSQIDGSLKRYRDDIFDDKYKRLDWGRPSRSITAHIARDGYWYIHPEQTRTLTIREAARLQTFPDRVRFAGPPSAAFRQIGNAVPPLLAEQVARSVRQALRSAKMAGPTTAEISERLVSWFEHKGALALPWLEAPTVWAALQAQVLLDRAPLHRVHAVWSALEKLDSPENTLESADHLRDLATLIGRHRRVERILSAARWFTENPNALTTSKGMRGAPGVGSQSAAIAALVDPTTGSRSVVVNQVSVRVASRVFDLPHPVRRQGSEGRLAVIRLLGGPIRFRARDCGAAMAAVLELGASVCTAKNPRCLQCPVSAQCQWYRNRRHVNGEMSVLD